MKNLINESPFLPLHGRLKFTVDFVSNSDIKDKKILDIGCGYGWCEVNFINRKAKSIHATEVTHEDLETITRNVKAKQVKIMVADASNLPFKNSTFDTVVCWEVLEHLPLNSQHRMFSESYRVLKPGGRLFFSTPYASWVSCLFDPAWWLIGHRHYSRSQLENMSRVAGFNIDRITVRGRFWEVLATLNFYICKWIFRRPPILQAYIYSQLDGEYKSEGDYDIFAQLSKPKKSI